MGCKSKYVKTMIKIQNGGVDPETEKCFYLPPSDPESLESNFFYMNQVWAQMRCEAIKYPGDEDVVDRMKRIDDAKKYIANEEQLNDLQILDVSCDEQPICPNGAWGSTTIQTEDIKSTTTHLDAILKEKDKTCAVFFPTLCKNTAMLNYVYLCSDVFSRAIKPKQSPKVVHTCCFLYSVMVYRPGRSWRSVLLIVPERYYKGNKNHHEMLFGKLLSGYIDDCCICTDPFSQHNLAASICPHCMSLYCYKCTKKLKKGRRKHIMCVYCKQKTLNYNDITKNTTGN